MFKTYLALLILLAATVGTHEFMHGWTSMILSLLIATAKATLVLWVFMKLRGSHPSIRWFLGGTLFLTYIALLFGLSDYLTRT